MMSSIGKKFVWITFQRKGYHFYPDAPEDVGYLRDRHRHLFKFKVKIEAKHTNREIEFHQFQNLIESWYDQGALELNGKSCEMIADDLYKLIQAEYIEPDFDRDLCIEVSEDGECGSESYYVI